MIIYYRISGSQKTKLGQFSDWKRCLINFQDVFVKQNYCNFIADNVPDDMEQQIFNLTVAYDSCHCTDLGNSASFRYALGLALEKKDDEIIYFVEDDYLHRPNSDLIIQEGLEIADYVTLYDHADKYMEYYTRNSWGGEPTKVLLTKSTHWKQVSSTCMTFAAKVKTLREDCDIIYNHLRGAVPEDWAMFIALGVKGRKLINPIPGYATHCITEYQSPLINWENV